MTIAREEIFGRVMWLIPYDREVQVIEIVNDTVYGLSACIQSGNIERACAFSKQLRVLGVPELPELEYVRAVWWLRATRQGSRVCRLGYSRHPRNQKCGWLEPLTAGAAFQI